MKFLAFAFVVGLAAAATSPPYCPWTKTVTAPGATKTGMSPRSDHLVAPC